MKKVFYYYLLQYFPNLMLPTFPVFQNSAVVASYGTSNRSQTPSLGYPGTAWYESCLPMLCLLLTQPLAAILFPAHGSQNTLCCSLQRKVVDALRKGNHHLPTPSLTAPLLRACSVSFRPQSPCRLLFVILPNLTKCQAHLGGQKILVEEKKVRRKEKGKKITTVFCTVYCILCGPTNA